MQEVLRSNDMVTMSFAASLLRDAGIEHAVFDTNMSIVEGSLGILPSRLMVDRSRAEDAKILLRDAGIEL